MKINFANSLPTVICRSRRLRAWTIIEMMTSLVLLALMLFGLITVNIFGLRQDELTSSKLGANDQSRLNFNLMLDEIRSCKNIQIGYGGYSNFTTLTNGQAQQGDSLQIIPSTNMSMLVYYWFDTNANALWRASTNNGILFTNMVCQYLTNYTSQYISNSMMFRALDYTGKTNLTMDPTNYNYNYVVGIQLQFYQFQFPQTAVGTNALYNYYQLTFSATRRNP